MAKQLNVNLAMTADTSKAKSELQSLQKQLDQLMLSAQKRSGQMGISEDIQKATQLAAQLKVQLESATSSTGNLDLSKFSQQLQKSKASIMDYKNALVSMGPAGTQAFSQLATSIMKAEVPLRRSSALLTNFATTLKNTARWQISSSILHGFMGAIQGAYGYAQDLNESLNNIRIVTGQNADQMAKFAEQANRAAKELSTTTTAYTDAALIYYQQGLDDEAVKARTDVTIKLANVSRQSAEEVSSQMTAIWNNFGDGSKNLEYYADVITKLGASTASSSSEIAQGLEKFAAVADTVGLSYEKATAALATVVAETRQSADVVGTAFKTLFARIQGLNLGETLEDGVTLNKYSAALKTVGVDILDANGGLKDMDSILNDLGEKWNTIGEEQKVALAETVAGTRQYAQFMAIMNNYDKILSNQKLAAGAEGTLQGQADIYAESWEAAGKRVKAAAQSIYSDLLDDKFFIKLLNGFEKALKGVDEFIDGIGGLKTLLPLIGSIFMQVFNQQIQTSLRNTINSFQMMSAAGRQAAEKVRTDTLTAMNSVVTSQMSTGEGSATQASLQAQSQLYTVIREKAASLTEEQLKQAQLHADLIAKMGEEAIAAGKNYDEQVRITKELEKQQQREAMRTGGYSGKQAVTAAQNQLAQQFKAAETAADIFYNKLNNTKIDKTNIDQYKKSILDMCEQFKQADIDSNDFKIHVMSLERALNSGNMAMAAGIFDRLSGMIDGATISTQKYEQILQSAGISEERAAEMARELANGHEEISLAAITSKENLEKMKNAAESSGNSIRNMKTDVDMVALSITTLSSIFMSLTSAINALKNLGSIWSNDDLSIGEKILQTMSAITMILPLVTALTNKNTITWAANLVAKKAVTAATGQAATAETLEGVAKTANTVITKGATAANLSFAQSIGLVTTALLPYIAIAAAVAVAIWAIVEAVKAYNASTLQGKIDAAKEKSKELNEKLEETKNKIEEISSKADSLDNLYKNIQNCKKGTQEWYNAFENINNAINDILEKDPELIKYIKYDENGVAYIDTQDSDYKKHVEEQQREYAVDQARVYENSEYIAQLERQQSQQQLLDSLFSYGGKSLSGFYLTDSEGFTSAINQEALSDFISKNITDLANNIWDSKYVSDLLEGFFTSQGFDMKKSEEALQNWVELLQSLAPELQDISSQDIINERSAKEHGRQVAAIALGQNQDVLSSEYTGKILELAGEEYSKAIAHGLTDEEAIAKIQDARFLDRIIEAVERQAASEAGNGEQGFEAFNPQEYVEVVKTLESLKSKDILSAEDLAKLGEGYDEYFVKMADGTYKLKGDAEEFYDLVMGQQRQELIDKITNAMAGGEDATEDVRNLYGMATSLEDLYKIQDQFGIGAFSEIFKEFESAFLNDAVASAKSLTEYNSAIGNAKTNGATVSQKTETNALKALAAEYDNATDELNQFNNEQTEANKQMLLGAIAAGEKAKAEKLDAEAIEYEMEVQKELHPDVMATELAELAKEQLKWDRAVEQTVKNLEAWKTEMEENDFLSAETAQDLASVYGDILDVDPTMLSSSFLSSAQNLQLLEQAINGSKEAYYELLDAANHDLNVKFNIDEDSYNDLFAAIDEIMANDDIEIGVSIDNQAVLDGLEEIVNAAGMTVEEATKYLSSLGFDAELITTQKVNHDTPAYNITPKFQEAVNSYGDYLNASTYEQLMDHYGVTYDTSPVEVTTTTSATALKITALGKSQGGHIKHRNSTVSTGKSSGGGGGGSSKASTKDIKNAAQEQDRYHEIKEVISDLTRTIDRLSKAKDRAFGKGRIQLIEQETAALNKQREAQEKYIDEIKSNLSLDKGAAMAGVAYSGLGIAFDSENRISNYNEIISAAVEKYNSDVSWWNGLSADAQQDEANQAKWEAIEEGYSKVKETMSQYEETLNLLEDAYQEAEELFYQWQDLNAEKLNYEIEIKVKLNDADLKQLQLIAKVLGDSVYKIPEVMANLFTVNGESQYQKFLQGAEDYKQFWEDAQAAYAAGEISQAAFVEMLEQARDGIQQEIESLLNMNEQMRKFYSDTLSKALNEISKITDQMAHQAAVIQHLKSLLSLSGREKDYGALDTLLRGATQIAKNAFETSKAQFEMFEENAQHAREVYEDLLKTSEEGAREYKEAVLDPAIEQSRKAEEQMYKDAEDYLNKANELFENSLARAAAAAEEYLTNGLGWDYIASSMDRAQAVQDEYLTKTNQIYETNTLLRKLAQDIDKSDSQIAKRKLKDFSDQIQAMQDQEKLSQTDLAIAKARYELLLAQIALEEAQNAKSTVRLQRDNEGNYGYVYTADQGAINDAVQNVADKQNDLYNLALEQANSYAEKILETERQKNEALMELAEEYHNNANMTEEEYQAKRAEIIQHYDDLLYAQRESFYTACEVLDDVAVTTHNEAWTSDYEDLIDKGTTYTEETTGFIDQIDQAIQESNEARKVVVEDAKIGLDELDAKTKLLTDSNDALANELINDVLPALDSTIDQVDNLTETWARQYDQIMATIQGYLQLIDTINQVIAAEAQKDAALSSRSTDVPASYSGGTPTTTASGSSGGSGGGSGGDEELTVTVEVKDKRKVPKGCFDAGTKILMSNNSIKSIENVKVGDCVMAYDENLELFIPKKVIKSYVHHNTEKIVSVILSNGIELRLTPGHPIYSLDGWKSLDIENSLYEHGTVATLLQVGDKIININTISTVVKISNVDIPSFGYDTYNIEVEDCHTYLANGVVVHNAKVPQIGLDFIQFASGGYTGGWDDGGIQNGKLAVLHQKELVLNQDDTENFLSAIKIVRQISDTIGQRAISQGFLSGISSPYYNSNSSMLEQQVTIHAEFPNAVNHNEIEEAFDNLINRASQYAGRPTVMPKAFATK